MILIAHRGNVNGKQADRENTLSYIKEALDQGYHCEIDICKWDGDKFWLGHDEPTEPVDADWLKNNRLWCHAKDYNSLEAMLIQDIHCFFHHNDDYTLTSQGYIWAYPGKIGGKRSIAVHPERLSMDLVKKFSGVCSDNLIEYKETK
jgi:hypothetical protein